MTRGITGREADPRVVYADIIDLPHPVSRKHPPMPLPDRAAQFAPFAALAGYEDMISEETRQTDEKIELGEDALSQLNQALEEISRALDRGERPRREITWFVPDVLKAGGSYTTAREEIRRLDPVARRLIFARTEGPAGSFVSVGLDQLLEIREI